MSTEAEAEDTWDQFETDDKTNVNAAPAEQPETASGPPEPSSFSASGLTDMLQNEPAVGSDESEWPQSPIPPMGCSSVAPVAESEKEMAIGATSGDGEHVESTCSFQMQRVKQNSHLEENQAAYNAGMAVGLTVETISGGLESPESQPQPQLRQEQQPSDEEAAVAETFWSTLTDVLLRVPMFGILQFFWFAFYVLAFGPNASVTVINLLFNVTLNVGLVFVYYTLLPPAVARLLYKWSLATVAGTFSILLSHLLLLDFGDRLWGASGYKPLAEILPVVAAACVAAVLAVVHSGVRRLIHLLPLVLLPVPILVHRTIGLGNSRRMLVAVEYFVYACALLLLLPAFHESLAAFLVRTRANLPHKRFFSIVQLISSHSSEPTAGENATAAARLTAIDENRLRRAVNRTVVSAALFTPIALLVYFVLSRLGLYRCHLFSRATTPSVPLVTSGPVPNNWSEWIANENLSAVTTTSGPISTLPTSPVRNNASSSQQWPFSRVFAFSVALLFESPVSLFAAAATLALMLYALLVATDTLLDRQSHNSNSGRRDSFVKHMRHVGRFDIGLSDLSTPLVYSLIALVFYGFANTSLSSLPAAERSDRMPLLGVWTAVCVVQMLYSAFDFHLQTLPYEKIRQLPKELLINGVLILLLLVSAVFITCNCWPFKSVTFWQQFWGLIILWLLILSLLKSAFGAVSAVCAIYLARSFKKAETVVLCVKLLFQLLLPLFPLWLFIQAVFNKEWNVLTCVTLFTCVVTPINSVWTIARGLWNAWRAIPAPLNGPVLTEDSDPELFEKLHSADQLQCRLCGGSIGEAQINEQEVARSACKHRPHYFHRSCLRMWLIDHSICPICREPQQSSETHIIELIVLAVRQLWSRAFALLLCILTRRLAKVDSPKAPPAQGTAIDISDTTSNVTNTIAADNQKDNRSRKSSEGQE